MEQLSDPAVLVVVSLLAIAFSCTLSASAGLGGSILLVPILSLALGAKQGIALSAMLLACNNVFKIIAYRKTLPFRASLVVIVMTIAGAGLGASVMVGCPDIVVHVAVGTSMALTLLFEQLEVGVLRRWSVPVFAFLAGAASGFSGTSGPLKGLALRNLAFDRLFFVGAASMVSLAGDVTKTAVFARAELFDDVAWLVAALAVPIMPLATLAGRRLNRGLGEAGYAVLFWVVMVAYLIRVVAV